jgi:hypothetical protein
MRGFFYCYFHRNSLEPTAPAGMSSYKLPVLEDPETIQVAITRVIQGVAYGTIDAVRAKFMLYALQIASQNIKRSNFKPSPTSVVTDLTSEMLMNHYSQNPHSPSPSSRTTKSSLPTHFPASVPSPTAQPVKRKT